MALPLNIAQARTGNIEMVLSQQMFAIWKLNPNMVKRVVSTINARTVENQSKNGTERKNERNELKRGDQIM